mmetsp:Transcript_19522/g.45391  ORF Transcript_19522/g.45391 Transcript_19522/m.45391 type:complete len:303 (+) Transcript_19522:417-1325(+)
MLFSNSSSQAMFDASRGRTMSCFQWFPGVPRSNPTLCCGRRNSILTLLLSLRYSVLDLKPSSGATWLVFATPFFVVASSSSSSSSHSSSSSSRLACGPFSSSNAESALEALFRALGATLSSALTGLAFAACSCIRLCTSPISACSVADGLHWPSVGSAISSCSSSTAFALLVFFFIAGSLSKSPVDGIAPDILLSSSFAGCAGLERRICSTRSRRVAFAGGADDKASLVGFLSSLLLAGFTPTSFICRLTFVTFCACFTAFLSCGSNFLSIVANFSCSSRSHTNCATTGCARTGAPSARKSK